MDTRVKPENFPVFLFRPYRQALYTNPKSGDSCIVDAVEAATLKAEFPDAEFAVAGQRVYPKPTVGTFAKWPSFGFRRGETAPESLVHRVAKAAFIELLESDQALLIQPVRRRSGDAAGEPFSVRAIAWCEEASIRPKRSRSKLQPDVLVQTDGGRTGHWMGVEVRNTHAVDYAKRRRLKLLPMTTIEIDVRGFLDSFLPEEELRTAMLKWFRYAIRARIVTLVGEDKSRAADDAILVIALRKPPKE